MISIAGLYPELLGTYGDGGNVEVLAQRLRWRGLDVETVTVTAGEAVPESCDLYVLGGGEDGPQTLAVQDLAASGALNRAVDRGFSVGQKRVRNVRAQFPASWMGLACVAELDERICLGER